MPTSLIATCLISALVFFCVAPAFTQDIEGLIKSEKRLTMGGGVNVSQNLYSVSGMRPRKDPYTIYAAGNLTFSFMQWSIPLTFSYSNQQFNFQYGSPFSFNRFSFQPSYKWVRIYAGYNNMSFSPYTMNGHTFLGGGVELTPDKKWKLAALYGQFQKPVAPVTKEGTPSTPAYKRMGYGVKFSYDIDHTQKVQHMPDYESQYDMDGEIRPDFRKPEARIATRKIQGNVEFILFAASDDPTSIAALPDSIKLYPQDNVTSSLRINTKAFKTLALNAEYAGSLITRNTLLRESVANKPANMVFGSIMETNSSSAYYKAFKTSLSNDFKILTLGGTYEYVDPDYTTLGAYYFNNDLESITANLNTRLLNQKVNLALNIGTQRNNLQDNKTSATQRLSISSNLSYAASEKLNISASYSDFRTVTRVRSIFENINQVSPYDNIDTLNFAQIAENYHINVAYLPSSRAGLNQSINGMVSFQRTGDHQGETSEGRQVSAFYNGNLTYTLGIQPARIHVSLACNYNLSDLPDTQTETWGPTLSVSKPVWQEKIKNSFSVSYNNTYINYIKTSYVFNLRFTSTYSRERHSLNANIVVLTRRTLLAKNAQPAFTESSMGLTYGYNF